MGTAEMRNKIIQIVQSVSDQSLQRIFEVAEGENDANGYVMSEAHKKIIDERLASHKENPNAGRSWEEVKADLIKKYGL